MNSCASMCGIPKVRWGLANEAKVKGSIDKALQTEFPEYTSRRYTHWRKAYFEFDWESVPDQVAAKTAQVTNKHKGTLKNRDVKMKGPAESSYKLPSRVEAEIARQGAFFWAWLTTTATYSRVAPSTIRHKLH